MTEAELRALLPLHKCDCEGASRIIALGYPAVAPVLWDLLEWLQDYNWPISRAIAPFLAAVGEPVFPLIREVFKGNDDVWKYWCIGGLIMRLPRELAEQFRADLQQLAFHPSVHEHAEEVDERARAALEWLDGANRT